MEGICKEMNDETKMKKPVDPDLVPLEIPGVETLGVVFRNINGEAVMFTVDGKLVGKQLAHRGHYYYKGEWPNRTRMFRGTFVIDDEPSDPPRQ